MKKLIGLTLLVLVCLAVRSDAASTRGAKNSLAINFSTVISTVVANAPGVVYGVTLSSGAAGDYLALFDSATGLGLTGANGWSTALKLRVYTSSATQNTVISFDPPLQFNSGIQAVLSAGTVSGLITYEKGRVVTGY